MTVKQSTEKEEEIKKKFTFYKEKLQTIQIEFKKLLNKF